MSRTKGATADKEWRGAIRRAVHELRTAADGDKAGKIKALTLLARKLVSKGLDGDVGAIREIGDRMDGKAQQGLTLSGEGELTLADVFAQIAARKGDGLPTGDDPKEARH